MKLKCLGIFLVSVFSTCILGQTQDAPKLPKKVVLTEGTELTRGDTFAESTRGEQVGHEYRSWAISMVSRVG
jgi:hypothetical protein